MPPICFDFSWSTHGMLFLQLPHTGHDSPARRTGVPKEWLSEDAASPFARAIANIGRA